METSKRCVKLFSLIFILKCLSKFNLIFNYCFFFNNAVFILGASALEMELSILSEVCLNFFTVKAG